MWQHNDGDNLDDIDIGTEIEHLIDMDEVVWDEEAWETCEMCTGSGELANQRCLLCDGQGETMVEIDYDSEVWAFDD